MQITIDALDWKQISNPGKNVSVWLDEQKDGAKGFVDVRVIASLSKPLAAKVTEAKKISNPIILSPKPGTHSFWAICANTGDEALLTVEESGIGALFTQDIYLQDQTSNIVDRFLTRKLGTAVLASALTLNSRTITLNAGHGFVIGNMIEIDDGATHFYQSRVINVATNVLTVTNPMTFAFPITSNVARVSPDANVDGSTTPVSFTACPPVGVLWDINILSINMLDDVAMDDGKFGGIAALTNGTIFRTVDGEVEHIFTAVDNGCFRRHCDTENPYSDKAPAGVYGLNVKRNFNSQQGDGVTRRIGGEDCAGFEVLVQDDLRALARFWIVIRGHVVED